MSCREDYYWHKMADETGPRPRKKVYCDVCCVFVSSESLLDVHNNGRKHQQLLKYRTERQVCAERGIYVQGFCNSKSLENDLHDYFSKFGNVTSVFVDKEKAKYAIVEFLSPTEAKIILDSNELTLFHGKHLKIKKRSVKELPARKPQTERRNRSKTTGDAVKVNHFLDEDVIRQLEKANTLDEQVKILMTTTCLSDDDNQLRDLIVQYLYEILVEAFPQCEVVPFGSFSTGLGLKGSDLDLCLFAEPASLQKLELQGREHSSSSSSVSDHLEFIVQLLKQFAAGFYNVVAVVSAKCPLVKFVHRDSRLSCDLSINNRLAIRNTELIKTYVALDDRIRPLAITLKNWGGAKHLTGSGGRQISNYCIVLMLLHFLQRVRPPVIPVLQKTHEDNDGILRGTDKTASYKTVIDGWDCSFASTMNGGESFNKESFGDLLKGWFCYYGHTFDYGNDVITIQNHENERLSKLDVSNSILKDSGIANVFKLSPLSVQDPLELSHNLTQGMSVDVLRRFIQSCMDAHCSLTADSTSNNKVSKEEAFLELFTLPAGFSGKQKKVVYSFAIPLFPNTPKSSESEDVPPDFERTCEFVTETLIHDLQVTCEPRLSYECKNVHNDDAFKISRDAGFDYLENNVHCVGHEVVCRSSCKRVREEGDGCTETGDVKKVKYCNRKEKNSFLLVCKAAHVTWQNRRRQRRLRKKSEGVEESQSSRSGFAKTAANQEKCLVDEIVEHDKLGEASLNTFPLQSSVPSNTSTPFEQITDDDKFQSLAEDESHAQANEMAQREKILTKREFAQAVLEKSSNKSISFERITGSSQEVSSEPNEIAQNTKNIRKTGLNQIRDIVASPGESSSNIPCERTFPSAALRNAKPASEENDKPLIEFTLKIEFGNFGQVDPNQNECNVILSYLDGSMHHFTNFYAFFKKFIVRKITEHMQ